MIFLFAEDSRHYPLITRLFTTTSLSATHAGQACPSRDSSLNLAALLAGASRVPTPLLCTHAITTTPANQHPSIVALYLL